MANTSTASYEQALALYQSGDFEASREVALDALQERARRTRPPASRRARRASSSATTTPSQYLSRPPRSTRTTPTPGASSPTRCSSEGPAERGDERPSSRQSSCGRTTSRRSSISRTLTHAARRSRGRDRPRSSRCSSSTSATFAALRGLVGMYREASRLEDALAAGAKLVAYRPEDVLAALDVAEL